MSAFNLIADAIRDEWIPLPCEPVEGTCAVTGRTNVPCVPMKKSISSNFVGWNELAAPWTGLVSVAAYQALKYKPERTSSWLVSKEHGFQKLRRIEVRPFVLNGVNSNEWCGYVTTSYKKHGAFRGVINRSQYGIWRFDDVLVDCSESVKIKEWWEKLDRFIRLGISRTCLELGDIDQWAIKNAGLLECYNFMKWSQDKNRDPLYKFLCYLLPSKAEIKEEVKSESS